MLDVGLTVGAGGAEINRIEPGDEGGELGRDQGAEPTALLEPLVGLA
jgi:hypothetical protein